MQKVKSKSPEPTSIIREMFGDRIKKPNKI